MGLKDSSATFNRGAPVAIPDGDANKKPLDKGPRLSDVTPTLPTWFMNNCVKTSLEIKEGVIPLEIRDTQALDVRQSAPKPRLKRKTSDEKFEKIMYHALRDALGEEMKSFRDSNTAQKNKNARNQLQSDDPRKQRAKRNTTHFEMESVIYDALSESLDRSDDDDDDESDPRPEAMFLRFPGKQTEPGCPAFIQAVVEHFAQDIDANLITISDEDFIDLAQHFAREGREPQTTSFDEYMTLCFPPNNHERMSHTPPDSLRNIDRYKDRRAERRGRYSSGSSRQTSSTQDSYVPRRQRRQDTERMDRDYIPRDRAGETAERSRSHESGGKNRRNRTRSSSIDIPATTHGRDKGLHRPGSGVSESHVPLKGGHVPDVKVRRSYVAERTGYNLNTEVFTKAKVALGRDSWVGLKSFTP